MNKEKYHTKVRQLRQYLREDHAADPTRSYVTARRLALIASMAKIGFVPYVTDMIAPGLFAIITSKVISDEDSKRKTVVPFIASLAYMFGEETAQKFHVWPGVYDPKDYIAYAAGALLWLGADTTANRFRRRWKR